MTDDDALSHLKESCYCSSCQKAIEHLRARLSDYDTLKAEVERLEKRCEGCIAVRPERLGQLIDEAGKWRKRAEKAEADLAAARPLLEAAAKVTAQDLADGEWTRKVYPVLLAALPDAPKEEK